MLQSGHKQEKPQQAWLYKSCNDTASIQEDLDRVPEEKWSPNCEE